MYLFEYYLFNTALTNNIMYNKSNEKNNIVNRIISNNYTILKEHINGQQLITLFITVICYSQQININLLFFE